MDRRLHKFSSAEDLAEELAIEMKEKTDKKAIVKENFFLSLSGGSTPKVLFDVLAGPPFNKNINWMNVHLFWGDERCVPPGDKESNYGAAKEILLNRINIPEKNIHRIKGENDPVKEVKRYTEEIFNHLPVLDVLPKFDLTILGLGSDGHTASLFPGQKLENVTNICGIAVKPDGQKRISLTKEVINNSERIIFLVSGIEKSQTLYNIISQKPESKNYPAASIKNIYGYTEWWVDEEASSKIVL